MKKFKLFIASVLTYFMVISLLPVKLLQTVANAAENNKSAIVESDYYLRKVLQYGNKTVTSYNSNGKVYISLFENGQETVLKEIESADRVEQYNIDGVKAQFVISERINGDYKLVDAYEYDINTNKIYKIEYQNLSDNFALDFSDWSFSGREWKPMDSNLENQILEIINKKYNTDYKILVDEYGSRNIDIKAQVLKDSYSTVNFDVIVRNEKHSIVRKYSGIYNDNFDFIRDGNNNRDLFSILSVNYSDDKLYILESKNDEDNKHKLYELKDGKISIPKEIVVEDGWLGEIKEINDNSIYGIKMDWDKNQKSLVSYTLNNNVYKKSGEYLLSSVMDNLAIDVNKNAWVSHVKDNKIILSKLENGELKDKVELPFISQSPYYDMQTYVHDENNMIITGVGLKTILFNKDGQDNNNPDEPSKPENPDNNDNVVIKPSEDKVVAEVSKINPNEKNEIKVNTESSAKKIEVAIKDVESIKNGTGSLNITVNNGVQLNLPLSTIDKNLLEGAKDVTISLDVIENSDIVKDIKGVNKVFDFNLVINKENGSTFVHNFKDGQAEVTINLTDKDLEGLNKDKIVVYYYNDGEKKFEAMETKVDGNKVTFKTSHFSKYVIAEKLDDILVIDKNENTTKPEGNTNSSNTNSNIEAEKGNLPNTGAVVSSSVVFALGLVALVFGGTLLIRRKKHA
ncbi:LPXTG cell wall anchor domain-containing protein [Clostridium sp. MB05]